MFVETLTCTENITGKKITKYQRKVTHATLTLRYHIPARYINAYNNCVRDERLFVFGLNLMFIYGFYTDRAVLFVHGVFRLHDIRQLQGSRAGPHRNYGDYDPRKHTRHGTGIRNTLVFHHRYRAAHHGFRAIR